MKVCDLSEDDPFRKVVLQEADVFARFVNGESVLKIANSLRLSQTYVMHICRTWAASNPEFDLSSRLSPKKGRRRYSEEEKLARISEIFSMRERGITLRVIGERFDISAEQVRQIFNKEMRRKKGIA